jgi:hypothetical protein
MNKHDFEIEQIKKISNIQDDYEKLAELKKIPYFKQWEKIELKRVAINEDKSALFSKLLKLNPGRKLVVGLDGRLILQTEYKIKR